MLIPHDYAPNGTRFLDPVTEPGDPALLGFIGGYAVRTHARKAFVVNQFELGFLYGALPDQFDLISNVSTGPNKSVGMIWGIPVEIAEPPLPWNGWPLGEPGK
jgi:hypothetical protein